MKNPTRFFISWWGRRESNSHGLPHSDLNAARIPIPPRPQICFSVLFGKLLSPFPIIFFPTLTSRYIGQSQTRSKGLSLAVTIRTKKTKIFTTIIVTMSVNVINR